ncbi:phosphotransferase family protein [Longispora urticae]
MNTDAIQLARRACRRNGIDPTGLRLLRAGENTLFLLPFGLVARVSRPGQIDSARKEVTVAGWLNRCGIPTVSPAQELDTPIVELNDRAVSFWHQLPPHTPCSPHQLGTVLRAIHALTPPTDFILPRLEPFARLERRIIASTTLSKGNCAWLTHHLTALQAQYAAIRLDEAESVLHGDAWDHNIVTTTSGPVVLDLERFAIGPPAWDLTISAVDHQTFATLTTADWTEFCATYGRDVTTWQHYPLFRDIRELRKATFAIQIADEQPQHAEQAQYRIACLRGLHGPRPWNWRAVP